MAPRYLVADLPKRRWAGRTGVVIVPGNYPLSSTVDQNGQTHLANHVPITPRCERRPPICTPSDRHRGSLDTFSNCSRTMVHIPIEDGER
jgi:hypothetical protein